MSDHKPVLPKLSRKSLSLLGMLYLFSSNIGGFISYDKFKEILPGFENKANIQLYIFRMKPWMLKNKIRAKYIGEGYTCVRIED